MKTNTTNQTTNRRHQNPTCTCAACRAFDQSLTLPIQRICNEGVLMTAYDTETGERFTYYYHQGVLHRIPADPSPTRMHATTKTGAKKPSFRALLHDFVLDRVEQSIKHHPFFWLCVSSLFR